ncbi:DUF4381 domain-containing protein [Congregibacter brevis]|uniref:DUF4381 domain-containing protein n=1 Tax=Congregibacter brevis TaxID=3081201 RepID=A0ABZ0ICK8_9GAMM|nr:DUF4381 domain-containing protein [Congregibacter sp. IMCC45268]
MTELFGPGWGNYAIRGIIETSVPEKVSLWPSTPGWWILLALVIFGSVYWGLARWQNHLRNRYRREAKLALDGLEAAYLSGDQQSLRKLAPLLRATAIAATGQRQELASAKGDAWQQALQKLAPKLPPLPVSELDALAYQPLNTQGSNIESLFTQLRVWISAHECRND